MEATRLSKAIVRLARLAERLRGPGGCPWDAKQTDQSVKNYLLEEAYEVLDAVEKEAPDLVCGELGDLLFQIVFLAQLASERGEFELADVIERIEQKMIRRHPHVFGNTKVRDADEVAANWAKIKESEKGSNEKKGAKALGEVPLALPALLRAHRLCERASKMNLGLAGMVDPIGLVEEGLHALKKEGKGDLRPEVEERIGWGLLGLVEAIRLRGKNAEDILRKTNQRFLEALEAVEKELREQGVEPAKATEAQLLAAWKQINARVAKAEKGHEVEKKQ
ncbi:MAG: nucleoside triphosphate pyrophosphohydrolase [Deltaproteobacteria bacterium]|nr:MAG: nucleoside triphosphate pyrophosphohydrolase [Deltaproteobacteria bacterium]